MTQTAEQVLKEAGLEDAPIDPISLEALQEYLQTATLPQQAPHSEPRNAHSPVTSRQDEKEASVEDDDDDDSIDDDEDDYIDDEDDDDSIDDEELQTMEDRLLAQLQRQTALIQQLQRDVDELKEAVNYWNSVTGDAAADAAPTTTVRQVRRPKTTRTPTIAEVGDRSAGQTPPTEAAAPAADETGNENAQQAARPASAWERLVKIVRLFVGLRRRQVPNFDGGLLFKVFILVCILMTRMPKRKKDSGVYYKVYLTAAFVIAGLLAQTGHLKFLYHFFWVQNYPRRIWAGEEDLDVDEAIRQEAEHRQRPPAERNAEEQAAAGGVEGWRNTIVGGAIERNDPATPFTLIKVVQDAFLLVGSFFLSIFPMWRPEGMGPVAAQQQQEEGLPEVRPPRDPLQAIDDDDDDDDNNGGVL